MDTKPQAEDDFAASMPAAEAFCRVTRDILECISTGSPRYDFLRQTLGRLMDFTGATRAELRLAERGHMLRCTFQAGAPLACTSVPLSYDDADNIRFGMAEDAGFEPAVDEIARGNRRGGGRIHRFQLEQGPPGSEKTLLAVAVEPTAQSRGFILFFSDRENAFPDHLLPFYEQAGGVFAAALANRDLRLDTRERVKELTCLYQVARLAVRAELSLDEIFRETLRILPPAWLYPHLAAARIRFEGRVFAADGFPEEASALRAPIMTGGRRRGMIEIAYRDTLAELDEGPFLREERRLLDTVAEELALIIDQREAEEDRLGLEEQLRHADRLATIGQIAAGVVHELNEPLGSILGFAQLAAKDERVPDQVAQDLRKIVTASLHAREVVRKMMSFARPSPPRKDRVNLNAIVDEGLYILESRCARAGIELRRELEPGLPDITADASQLYQVLVNLVVNAVQAMPDGGHLVIRTRAGTGHVALLVEDTGVGMKEEVREKILLPFFTTKDVNEGTGLGLAVVNGIVSSHGGRIEVRSREGEGSVFEIRLPRRNRTEHNVS